MTGTPVPSGPGFPAAALIRAVAAHPSLWPTASAMIVRLAPTRWWCRRPPLPRPDAGLWRFRMETAYGGAGDDIPRSEDVLSFLRWCRDMRRWRKA